VASRLKLFGTLHLDEAVGVIDPELRASTVGAPESGPRPVVIVADEIGERVVDASLAQFSAAPRALPRTRSAADQR
jgi:hypothetical protein